MNSEQKLQHLKEDLRRRELRASFEKWAKACGFTMAAHHRLLGEKLEAVERGDLKRLIVCMPPGSAKSTYISDLFPPWYLQRKPGRCILSCSYSYNLIEGFGRRARNRIELHDIELGMSLAKDSKAAGEWETTNGGRYFCAGTNAGIAGHRADLGAIDDPIGSQEDAASKLYRDKQWDWFWADFVPRLKPGGAIVIVANRRHEEDLVGRLIAEEGTVETGGKWNLINIPFIAEDKDVLGRAVGAHLWPEWFTESMVTEAMKNPYFTGIYQQRPSPEEGDFFKKDWLIPYTQDELARTPLRFYCGSDHAVGLKQQNDRTCLLPVGVDSESNIWLLPDIFWKRAPTDEVVEAMLDMCARRKPLCWWAGREHITRSIGPFLSKRGRERGVFLPLEETTSARDKPTRAQSIRGRAAQGKLRVPAYASWWTDARHELLMFPNGSHDDLVDALSEIGRGLDRMSSATLPMPERDEFPPSFTAGVCTMKWLKEEDRKQKAYDALMAVDA